MEQAIIDALEGYKPNSRTKWYERWHNQFDPAVKRAACDRLKGILQKILDKPLQDPLSKVQVEKDTESLLPEHLKAIKDTYGELRSRIETVLKKPDYINEIRESTVSEMEANNKEEDLIKMLLDKIDASIIVHETFRYTESVDRIVKNND